MVCRIVIAAAIVEALHGLDLAFPDVDERKKNELQGVKDWLLANKPH